MTQSGFLRAAHQGGWIPTRELTVHLEAARLANHLGDGHRSLFHASDPKDLHGVVDAVDTEGQVAEEQ
jgi:hypothetical protein